MAAIPPSLLQMFGPIESVLTDPTVRRVLVDAPDAIYVERHGRLERTPLGYPPAALEASLEALARRAGKPFDAGHPSLEAQLKDGTRFLALRPPAVERGPTLVVVRPGGRLTDLDGLVRQDALTAEAAAALTAAMRAGVNIAVVGPADSGRTTLLEALASTIDAGARVAVLEEHAELRLPGREPMRLQSRKADKDGGVAVTTGDLLYFAGRMAVDRIIIGDLRWQDASECVHLLAARLCPVLMALPGTGVEDALVRLEALARASATGGRERAVAGLLRAGVDVVVTLGRREGQRVVWRIECLRPQEGEGTETTEVLFRRTAATGFALCPEASVAERTAMWRAQARPGLGSDDDGDRETLGYLPAIPLMTESHRLPDLERERERTAAVVDVAPPSAPGPVSPAIPPPASGGIGETSVGLPLQVTPARLPLPVPKGASLGVTPPPPALAPEPPSVGSGPAGGDPLATDNMFATLRPGLPGEGVDPLRRLLQGLKPGDGAAPASEVDVARSTDAAAGPPPGDTGIPTHPVLESDDDEERTVVNDAVGTSTARDEGAENRGGKTFSQVLRNLGVGPGESQEISGAWTGVNVLPQGRPTSNDEPPRDPDATRETDSIARRTTRVHPTDDE